ncbi:MAG: hypothetical protein ACX933_18290, partial [Marinobacter adhaerens]
SGIDERSKVRRLIEGIRAKELESVTNTVLSRQDLYTDFDASVNLYKDTIRRQQGTITRDHRNISALSQESTTGVENRNYKRDEYARLTPEQKAEHRELRKQAKKKKAGAKAKHESVAKVSKTLNRSLKALKRKVASLKQTLVDKRQGDTESSSDSESDGETEEPMKDYDGPSRNRKNPALTRQKVSRGKPGK